MPRPLPVLLSTLLLASAARADSPLTSIDLSQGYEALPAVQAVRRTQPGAGVPAAALDLLTSGARLDEQVAVLFALQQAGLTSAGVFLERLAAQRHVSAAKLTVKDLNVPQRFLLGTAMALADLGPEAGEDDAPPLLRTPPLTLLDGAAAALPGDFTVQYVRALVVAQGAMGADACAVFKGPDAVLRRFPPARRTLRPRALQSATDYLELYEADCPGSAAATRAALTGLNELYEVVPGDGVVVTAAQTGAVAWQGTPPRPVAVVQTPLCVSAVAVAGAPVVACRDQLLRWDGRRFEVLAALGGREEALPQVLLGPGGALWVREGARTRRWNDAARTLTPVKAPWPDDAYQVAVAPNGSAWWTRFQAGLGSTGGEFPLRSREYPGSDPRRVTVTAGGVVWVEDFADGLWRFDEASWRFVREPLVASKASGVAVEPSSQRLLALEYERGLVVQRRGGEPVRVDLSRFEYLRAVAAGGPGEAWVASTKGLLHLREREGQWEVEVLRVATLPKDRPRR